MHVHDDPFKTKRPEYHAIADDEVSHRRRRLGWSRWHGVVTVFLDKRVNCRACIHAKAAHVAGGRWGDITRGLFRQRGRLLLQAGDDRVNLGASVAKALIELLVEPQLERLFALPQRFLTHASARIRIP